MTFSCHFSSTVKTFAILLTATAAVAAHAASGRETAHESTRMETTNTTESAPLNSVNRAFARVESHLEATFDSQRLTYRALRRTLNGALDVETSQVVSPAALTQLLEDVSGDENMTVTALALAETEAQIHAAVSAVSPLGESAGQGAIEAVEAFAGAVKAALGRTDVKAYSATVKDGAESSRVFILVDEETDDLLLIEVTKLETKQTAAL